MMNRRTRLLAPVVILLGLAGCTTSEFGTPADVPVVRSALEDAGLQVCSSAALDWSTTPGFVSGTSFVLSTDCTNLDVAHPGASVTVSRYESLESRDAAQARFLTQGPRGAGIATAWTLGPLLITIDGGQKDAVVERFRAALRQLGAH
jgi:hypothetical protein